MKQSSIETPQRTAEAEANKIYFSARTQFHNAGDALINRELLRHLRAYGVVEVFTRGVPQAFIDSLRLTEREHHRGAAASFILRAAFSGFTRRFGSDRQAYFVLTPGDPITSLDAAALARAFMILCLALSGVRILRLGVSMTRPVRWRMAMEARLSRFIVHTGLRDSLSLKAARAAGLQNIAYFPDLVLTMDPPPERPRSNGEGPLCLGLAFRDDVLDAAARSALLDTVDRTISSISGRRPIKVLCVAQVATDAAFLEHLRARYAPLHDCELIDEQNPDRLAEVYRGLDIVLTNRLHGFLYSAANGCMPFALLCRERNQKIIGLLNDIGLADLWLDLAHFNTPGTVDLENLERARGRLIQAFRYSDHVARTRLDAVFSRETR